MKKLMMIGLIAITPFVATPSHSISPEVVKLVLAGTGYIGSMKEMIQNGLDAHNAAIGAFNIGSGLALCHLADQTSSLLIRGISGAIIGYTALAGYASGLTQDLSHFDKTGAFLYRSVGVLGVILSGSIAAKGTKYIIDGIAEKFETKPQAIDLPVEQEEQEEQEVTLTYLHTDLHIAVEWERYDQVLKLVKAGADVNARTEYGLTPLHYAASNGYTDIAKMLINAGADVNACGNENYTPLLAAVARGQLAMVKILLEHNADTALKDDEEQTPYDLAIKYGHTEIAQLLTEHEIFAETA